MIQTTTNCIFQAMRTKNTLLTATACLALASSANALYPVLGGEIGVSLGTKYGYDSNINANSNENGDSILTITPAVQFVRNKGVNSISLGGGFNIIRYDRFGNDQTVIGPNALGVPTPTFIEGNNSINPYFYASVSGPNGVQGAPLVYNLMFAFSRNTSANSLVGQITDVFNYDFSADFNYRLNDLWALGISPAVQYQDYRTNGFADVFSTSLALDGQYSYSEKLTFDAGYRIRYQYVPSSSSGPTNESLDHTLFVGAFGVLAPKLTGNVQTGISYREWLKPNSQSDFVYPYVNAAVSWAVNEKTSLGAMVNVDVGQSPANQGLETASAGVSATHILTDQFTADAGFDYVHTFFTGTTNRSDNAFILYAGIDYDINKWAAAGLNTSYQWNDSDVSTFQYDRWQIFADLTVSF